MLTDTWQKTIPSLVFVHIPIYAMAAFQNAGVNKNQEPGINDDNPLAPQGITDGTYTGDDIPFMSALLNTSKVIAVFSGHDHGDDWCVSRASLPLFFHLEAVTNFLTSAAGVSSGTRNCPE
jgi:hypothetical protein